MGGRIDVFLGSRGCERRDTGGGGSSFGSDSRDMGEERLCVGIEGGWRVQGVGEEEFGNDSLGWDERGGLGRVEKGSDSGDFRWARLVGCSWRKWRGRRGVRILYSHTMINQSGMSVGKGVHKGALLLLEVGEVRDKWMVC